VATWILTKIEQIEKQDLPIVICGICRHFTQIHPYLLDVGALDNLVELRPPTKDQRYQIIKEHYSPSEEFARTKEVKLQQMSQQTEYFVNKDLYWLKCEL